MMKVYTTIQRSVKHEQFCEDFLEVITPPTATDWLVGVVADGCSSGKDSHLAAILQCKIIRKLVHRFHFTFQDTPQSVALQLLHQFMKNLSAHKETLALEWDELLATLVLFVYQKSTKKAFFVVLGDGVVAIDQQLREFDQANMPDYPSYHLEKTSTEWQQYFALQTLSVEAPQQFCIATDGVLAITSTRIESGFSAEEACYYLLVNKDLMHVDSMLNRKCNILQKQKGCVFVDDIAVIRVIVSA